MAVETGQERSDFVRGYICAVAEIIRTHGDRRIAADVLKGVGVVDWAQIDDLDVTTLRQVGLCPLPGRGKEGRV